MKHIKLFEGFADGIYDVKDIYSWWAEINVTEDDEYYIIDLENEYLTNKIIQLRNGLRNKVVKFYSKYQKKSEILKIKTVEYNETYGELIFKTESIPNSVSPNDIHIVDTTKPIKISKLHIAADKYNL